MQDLDQAASAAVQAERSVTSDISSMLQISHQFAAAFDEEANFCAGATQIHTHSPTCVKYSIKKQGRKSNLCRFKAPWRLVEKTAFTEDGVLRIQRRHEWVNRWNKAMAVGLRHNHDISFIATQCKTLAIVYYVTNYATKVEDPVWKRVAAAADVFRVLKDSTKGSQAVVAQVASEDDRRQNKTRQFLMRVANRIFTERPLSQVEVVAHLLGYPTEFANNDAWTFLNASSLYCTSSDGGATCEARVVWSMWRSLWTRRSFWRKLGRGSPLCRHTRTVADFCRACRCTTICPWSN